MALTFILLLQLTLEDEGCDLNITSDVSDISYSLEPTFGMHALASF